MLDTSPRVILVQNVGLFSVGDSLNASKIAGDLTETNARVISSVEETTKYKFISEKDLFDVECCCDNWWIWCNWFSYL